MQQGQQQGLVTPQVIQLQPTQVVNNIPPPPGGIQIVQQIVGANGEIQQFPIQLTSQQLQLIRAQMTGNPIHRPIFMHFYISFVFNCRKPTSTVGHSNSSHTNRFSSKCLATRPASASTRTTRWTASAHCIDRF